MGDVHSDLCVQGERWLRRMGCRVTLRDPFKAAVHTGECPDVIGWRDGHSILIECKASRSDFLCDRKKSFRANSALGMGDARLYLAPPGVIAVDDLPEGWGLLIAHERKVEIASSYPRSYEMKSYGVSRKTRKAIAWWPYPFEGNKRCETIMLVSALARTTQPAGDVGRGNG